MATDTKISRVPELQLENEDLREHLRVAEETLQAIRRGEVDSLVAHTPQGYRVFILEDAHTPYRLFIEEMQQGAATLGPDGTILYVNHTLAALLRTPIERVVGVRGRTFVAAEDAAGFEELLGMALEGGAHAELSLRAGDGTLVPVSVLANPLSVDGLQVTCLVITDMTERRKAEKRIQLQAERYAAILATSSDGFWVLSRDARLLDVNDTYCRMSGYSRDELLQLSLSQIDAIETPEETAAHLEPCVEHGFDRFETRHRTKDGRVLEVEISISYWPGTEQFLLFVRDITERKRAEKDIHYQKTLLQCQNEATPDGILVVHADKVVLFNRHFSLMWSIPEEIIAPRSFPALLSWMSGQIVGTDPWFARHQELAVRPDDSGHEEITLKDGRTFERYTGPVEDEKGQNFGRIYQYHDVTDRKVRELELKKLSLALEQSAVSVVITDTQGMIGFVNPRFCEITNYQHDDLIGVATQQDQPGRPLPELFRKIGEVVLTGAPWHGEFWDRKRSGTRFWVSASISPLRNSEGRITHCVAIVEDATSVKQGYAIEQLFHSLHQKILEGDTIDQLIALACEQISEMFTLSLTLMRIRNVLGFPASVFVGGPASKSPGNPDPRVRLAAEIQPTPISSIDTGHPVVFDLDDSPDVPPDATVDGHGLRSGATFALKNHDEVIGELSLYSGQNDLFSPEILDRLRVVAERLGVALGRARSAATEAPGRGAGLCRQRGVHYRPPGRHRMGQ